MFGLLSDAAEILGGSRLRFENCGPSARIVDHQLHQQLAETMAFQIGAHENGVFSVAMLGIGMHAHERQAWKK
jgi:hypothetical protein